MPYIGKSPSAVGVRNRFYFTASGGETSLSGSDDNGKTLVFSDASYVDVILNGGNLVSGTDYTATPSTNTISGLTALVANDIVEIIAYDVFSVSDTVSAASGGTFQSNVNFDSGIDVTGNVTVTGNATFADNGKAIFGAGSDLQIYHTGSDSRILDNGTGNLKILGTNIEIKNAGDTAAYLDASNGAAVNLYYNGSAKLATTSTGIDVTGTVVADGLTVNSGTTNTTATFQSTDAGAYINFTDTTGTSGIGNDTVYLYLDADKDNVVAGSQIRLRVDGSTKLTILDSGNVGIGTTSPASQLTINRSNSALYSTLRFTNSGASGRQYEIGLGGSTSAAGFANNLYFYDSTASSNRMVISSNGYVGIGTTSPSDTLEVSNNSNYQLRLSSAGENYQIGRNGSDGLLYFYGNQSGYTGYVFSGVNGERMRIDSSGNVSIGSINPQFKLHLNNLVTIPNGRYLTDFFGTFEVTAANHHVMISVDDDTSTANPKAVGITLHNESQTDNTFAPAITWGNQSNSGNFSQSTAAIAARRTTQGNDANWHGGELYFYTAVSSGGTGLRTRMIIDDAGRVTMPYQPAFCAHANGSSYSANTPIIFQNPQFNIGSHYNATNGRFTAPVSGRYIFYTQLLGDSSGNRALGFISVNGASGASGQNVEISGYTGAYNSVQASTVLNLSANDYVQIVPSNTYYYSASTYQNIFYGYLIG